MSSPRAMRVIPPETASGSFGKFGEFSEEPLNMTGLSEDAIQMALLEWLRLYDRGAWELTHHSPNGGARSAVTGARLKAMGVRRGFPDLTLWLPRGGFHGLAVELKAAKGRPTPEQLDWLAHMSAIGWRAEVCCGFEAAQDVIASYLRADDYAPKN